MQAATYDIDKLAHAVAFAETSGCKDGTARKRMNCFGIMQWDNKGNRSPRYFKTHEESFAAFKSIWSKSYGRFPTMKEAIRWTGSDHAEQWLATVTQVYNSL